MYQDLVSYIWYKCLVKYLISVGFHNSNYIVKWWWIQREYWVKNHNVISLNRRNLKVFITAFFPLAHTILTCIISFYFTHHSTLHSFILLYINIQNITVSSEHFIFISVLFISSKTERSCTKNSTDNINGKLVILLKVFSKVSKLPLLKLYYGSKFKWTFYPWLCGIEVN